MTSLAGRELLLHCPFNATSVLRRLGEADYSYFFVMKRFLPVLETLAPVTVLEDLAGLDEACARSQAAGRNPVALVFAPPHRMPDTASCQVVPVFAWEFDAIPDECWGDDPNQNWAAVLAGLPAALTHSLHTVAAVRRKLGDSYRIASLPAPVWDDYAALAQEPWTGESRTIRFRGTLLDSGGLGLEGEPTFEPIDFVTADQGLTLSGIVFTSIANPEDGRKNWRDQLSAFVWTFRDDPRVTLVFKLVHHDRDRACAAALLELRKLAPFRCRIVVIHGYLEDPDFHELIRATTYAVNASRGEGQCLPLMEFMSAGRPAVAPTHTALAEYVNEGNALTVRASQEWTFWPQDPRRRLTCMRYRIDWDSLCDAFAAAAKVAAKQPDRYRAMATQAAGTLGRHCSRRVVGDALQRFLESLPNSSHERRRPTLDDDTLSRRETAWHSPNR